MERLPQELLGRITDFVLNVQDALSLAASSKRLNTALHFHILRSNIGPTVRQYILNWAAGRGLFRILQMCQALGAELDKPCSYGLTALEAASHHGQEAIVGYLLYRGVQINGQVGASGTALCYAADGGHESIVRQLIAHKADVNARGGNGNPLCAAASRGHLRIVEVLLDHGADPNIQLGEYATPHHAASVQGHKEVMAMLVAHGARVNPGLESRKTPRHRAIRAGQDGILRLPLCYGKFVTSKQQPQASIPQKRAAVQS